MNEHYDKFSACTLFVGDLAKFCGEIDLRKLFSEVGEVTDIKVKRNSNGKSLNYGFVSFRREEDAEAAMILDGTQFNGRPVRFIFWFMLFMLTCN
jgi:RNA recognition motif-containing protein